MAIIRWDNVPIPDFNQAQARGTNLAAQLLNNAAGSALAGVAGLEKLQADQRAATVAAADRFALENMLSTQDPTKFNQMRADGSLLGPAANQVSNATLQAVEQRGNQLYSQDLERTDQRELRNIQPILDQAFALATHSPDAAQEMLAKAGISNAQTATGLAKDIRNLYVPPKDDSADKANRRKEEQTRASVLLAEKVMKAGNASPEVQGKILDSEPDPLVRFMAVGHLKTLGEDSNPYYSSAPVPDSSVTGDVPGIIDGPENAQYRQFGNNMIMGMRAAGPQNPPPGTAEWSSMNGDRTPTQADMMNWTNKYVLPGSERELGEGKGTTATGPYQIVNKTRADFIDRYGKSLFGTNDPSKIPFTPENEEKLASKIYSEQKAGAWAATQKFKGLADGSAFKGVPWSDAKGILQYIDGGVAPRSFTDKVKQSEDELKSRELNLSEGARVILNSEPNKGWGLAEASEDLTKFVGKDARPGEIRSLIDKTVREAKQAGSTITYAEAVGLIKNALSDDGNLISTGIFAGKAPTISNLSDDLDLEQSRLTQTAKDLANARADLDGFKRNQETHQKLQELSTQYQNDLKYAKSQLELARRGSDAGKSAINAFAKLQDTSDRLRKLVAPKGETGVSISLVDDARPNAPNQSLVQPTAPAPRRPDIDLMLGPTPQSDWTSILNKR